MHANTTIMHIADTVTHTGTHILDNITYTDTRTLQIQWHTHTSGTHIYIYIRPIELHINTFITHTYHEQRRPLIADRIAYKHIHHTQQQLSLQTHKWPRDTNKCSSRRRELELNGSRSSRSTSTVCDKWIDGGLSYDDLACCEPLSTSHRAPHICPFIAKQKQTTFSSG